MEAISGKKGLRASWRTIAQGVGVALLWALSMFWSVETAWAQEKPPELMQAQSINGAYLADFTTGSFEGTQRTAQGELVLAGPRTTFGVYYSPVLGSAPFTEAVLSWNAATSKGTNVEVQAQVRVDGKWSAWFSWGKWNSWSAVGSENKAIKDELAVMDIDTLKVTKGKMADALRYRVYLSSVQAQGTPQLTLLAVAVNAGPTRLKEFVARKDVVLEVPAYAQRRSDPSIAGQICSPMSMAMALNYHGVGVLPEEMAWRAKDHSQDRFPFGNWSFNCAAAADFGLKAYVAHENSLAELRETLQQTGPVIASVMYKNSEAVPDELPVLHGAPVEATDGHLVVVRGLVQQGGKDWVIVNDPAGDSDSVQRQYEAGEFEKAWTHYVYVIAKEKKAVLRQPRRIPVKLLQVSAQAILLQGQGGERIPLELQNIGSIVKRKNQETIGFLQPETLGALLLNLEKDCEWLLVTKQQQTFCLTF